MDNQVSLNSISFTHALLCLIVSMGRASLDFMSNTSSLTRICPVSDQKTHCFQSYNQGYRKTGNN